MAASGKLQGFFKDITNWNGVVIGTIYEQATDEITISVGVEEEELNVLVTMINPKIPPYSESEELGISSYRIEDMFENAVVSDSSTDMTAVNDGHVDIKISLNDIEKGNYKLIIDSFVSAKKADQPLRLYGIWEADFVK